MSKNRYGLDVHYFKNNLKKLLRDIDNYKPDEMARALTRLAVVADVKVIRESEFSTQDPRIHKMLDCVERWRDSFDEEFPHEFDDLLTEFKQIADKP